MTEATNPPTVYASDPGSLADTGCGKPCVRFDGSTQRLLLPAAQLGPLTAGVDRAYFFIRRNLKNSGQYLFLTSTGGAESLMSSNPGGRVAVSTSLPLSPFTEQTREITCEVWNFVGGTLYYYRDGVLVASIAQATQNVTGPGMYLGTSGSSNYSSNDIFEMGIKVTGGMTTAEIAQLASYAESTYGITPGSKRSGTVMWFGDSNVSQNIATNLSSAREQCHARWPGVSFVGQLSGGAYSNHEGVAGNTISQMQARLGAALAANPNPTVMIVWGGVNDAAGGASGATIANSMDTFVRTAAATAHGTKYRIIELPPNANSLINMRVADYNAAMPAKVAAMASAGIDARFITMGSQLSSATDLLDGTHLNDRGHGIAARLIDAGVKSDFTLE